MRKTKVHSAVDPDKLLSLCSCLIAAVLFYFITSTNVAAEQIKVIQMPMSFTVLGLAVLAAWTIHAHPQWDRHEVCIWLFVVMGIVIRVGYMLYTPATVRIHDLGRIAVDADGHVGYILQILNGALPATNSCQCYHPPLYHMLAAGAMWIYQRLSGLSEPVQLLEAAKVVSCCASVITLIYAKKTIRLSELSKSAELIAIAMTAFLPAYYLLAGLVNNDSLSVMFMMAIMYYTLVWYRHKDWCSIIKLAFCFGLGMMTKMSVAVFALVTGGIMLLVLYKDIKERHALTTIRQYLVFGAVSFPLGLWYPIRNYILFKQPLNYVMLLSETNEAYTGNYSFWQRFVIGGEFGVYNYPVEDYNIWRYLLRGAVFGEFGYDVGYILPGILILTSFILAFVCIAATVIVLRKKSGAVYVILEAFGLVMLVSYLLFNVSYPFSCTMDFRYIVPTALVAAIFAAKGFDILPADGRMSFIRTVIIGTVCIFCTASIVMYCNLAW